MRADAALGPAKASKAFRLGTHRLVPPAATVERARRLLGPAGITRVANVTGLDCIGIPVVLAFRPNSRSLATSAGKGLDLDSARASALMEAIELFHAERIDHPLTLGSRNDLRFSHDLAPVSRLPRVAASRFSDNEPILWIAGRDLFSSTSAWLPYELVHTNFVLPLPTGSGCFVLTSNGLASGNHLLEATVHALSEVIERDATTLFHLLRPEEQERRRIDLDSVHDPACREVLASYASAGVLVGAWETTTDVSVPAFRSLIVDRTPNPFRPMPAALGFGCHPTREVALLRALTEAAQSRVILIAGSRDDTGRLRASQAVDRDMVQSARERLAPRAQRRFDEGPTFAHDTFEDDLACILRSLRAAGMGQAFVVDLTRPEFGVPVVRVVVPGLEAHHGIAGYLPGDRARRVQGGGTSDSAS
jgi:ribosomal protein S12 methylthiotransferase accessory factor